MIPPEYASGVFIGLHGTSVPSGLIFHASLVTVLYKRLSPQEHTYFTAHPRFGWGRHAVHLCPEKRHLILRAVLEMESDIRPAPRGMCSVYMPILLLFVIGFVVDEPLGGGFSLGLGVPFHAAVPVPDVELPYLGIPVVPAVVPAALGKPQRKVVRLPPLHVPYILETVLLLYGKLENVLGNLVGNLVALQQHGFDHAVAKIHFMSFPEIADSAVEGLVLQPYRSLNPWAAQYFPIGIHGFCPRRDGMPNEVTVFDMFMDTVTDLASEDFLEVFDNLLFGLGFEKPVSAVRTFSLYLDKLVHSIGYQDVN